MGTIIRRIRFEPVVVRGAIVAVALLLGYELDAEVVGEGINSIFEALAVAAPLIAAVWARFKTRSKASLEEQGVTA